MFLMNMVSFHFPVVMMFMKAERELLVVSFEMASGLAFLNVKKSIDGYICILIYSLHPYSMCCVCLSNTESTVNPSVCV